MAGSKHVHRRGEVIYSLDPKIRLTIPIHAREYLGPKFMLTRGMNEKLLAVTTEHFEAVSQELKKNVATYRYYYNSATEVELDKNNRIKIPHYLRDWAGLKGGMEIVVVGSGYGYEIWEYRHYFDTLIELEANWKNYYPADELVRAAETINEGFDFQSLMQKRREAYARENISGTL